MSANIDSLAQMQNNTNMVQFQNGRKNLGSGKMDREGFMQLMLAQLQYQDPMAPQDNTQMLTQQLQLQQADQINDMTNATRFSQASSLIGKAAQLVDARWDFDNSTSSPAQWDASTNSPKVVTGVIQSVQFDPAHGKALVQIDGNYYDSTNIKNVFDPTSVAAN